MKFFTPITGTWSEIDDDLWVLYPDGGMVQLCTLPDDAEIVRVIEYSGSEPRRYVRSDGTYVSNW